MPENIFQQNHFSSTHPLLQDVWNRRLLFENSEQAEKLRDRLIKDVKILIVGGGSSTADFYELDVMRDLGVITYIMDYSDSVWNSNEIIGMRFNGFIACDLNNVNGVGERAKKAIKDANLTCDFFDAVISFEDRHLYKSALVAKALNRDMNDCDAFWKTINKDRMRQALLENGLPVPRFRVVQHMSEMDEACDHVGFPSVVKLATGLNSIGVYRTDTLIEAKKAFQACKEVDSTEAGAEDTTVVLVEEYLDGKEVDIDVVLSNGKCVYCKVSDNWWQPPYFQDYGIHSPSSCSEKIQTEMTQLSLIALEKFGFRNGTFHCEGKYCLTSGPQLLEINARPGGDPVVRNQLATWGVNLIREHLYAVVGISCRPLFHKKLLGYSVGLLFNAPYSGMVSSDTWLDHLQGRQNIRSITYSKKKGDAVTGPETDVPTVLAIIILFSPESRANVNEFALSLLKTSKVPIDAFENVDEKPFFVPGKIFPFVC